ncbi:MAG TPA: RNA polymerase sigma factor [Bryobacteraceae bacterium]|nr:RNA polymerase sigma factor [Bryobacteraceae bacterium]
MNPTGHNQTFLDWVLTYDAILWKIARSYAPYGEHTDLHQDLLIALWHAAPLYRDHAKPSTFIYRVALNCALNWSRNRARYHRRYVELDETAIPVVAAPEMQEQERRVELLYAALAALPEADRSLALLHLDGISYRDIAEVLGITENHVGVKLNRVRKRLAEQLRRMEEKQ